MATLTYTALSLATVMSTDLNSLADGAVNVGGTIVDNTSNEYRHLVAELVLASVDLSGQVPYVDLYMIPSADGTNYADTGTDASTTILPPGNHRIGAFIIEKTSAAHRAVLVVNNCLQVLKYTPVLVQFTGAAFGAADNTLKIATNTDDIS